MAMVIGRRLRSRVTAAALTRASARQAEHRRALLVLDGPHDREPAREPGRIRSREHRDADAEDDGDARSIGHGTSSDQPSPPPASTTSSAADDEPGDDPEDRAGDAEDPGLDDDRAPDLAAGHPGRAQDADLADPLEDVHGQGVDDPEGGDEDGDDRERVEQPEDPAEGVVDGARDRLERARLEGRARGPSASTARPGRRRRARVRSGPRRRRRRRRRSRPSRRASRRGSPRRPCPGSDRSTMPATRRSSDLAAARRRGCSVDPTRQAEPVRDGPRDDRRPRRRRGRRAPRRGRRHERAAGRRRRGRRRRPRPRRSRTPSTGDVERRDRADPGDAVDGRERRPRTSSSRATGRIEVSELVARDRRRRARPRPRPRVLADAAERDDHRQADRQRPDGQRRPARGRGRSPRGRAAPRAGRRAGTAARPPGRGHRQDERARAGRAEQQRRRRRATGASAGPAGVARPDEQAGDADGHEHGDQPAQPRAPRRRRARPRSRSASTGGMRPARRAGSRAAASVTPRPISTTATTDAGWGSARSNGTARDRPELERHQLGEDERRRRARAAPRRPRGSTAWARTNPVSLAARRARRPQQPDLADPLGDGHRQRVEDQERADEQGDRGDQRGRRLEVGGRAPGATRRGRPATTGRTARPVRRDLERSRSSRRSSRPGRRADVDAADRVVAEDRLRRRAAGRTTVRPSLPAERPVAGEDPDDSAAATGPSGPWIVTVPPSVRPSVRGEALGDRAPLGSSGGAERPARGERRGRGPGRSAAGSMPRTVTGAAGTPGRPSAVGAEVGPPLEGRRGDRDARRRLRSAARLSRRQAGLARTPRRAGPPGRRDRGPFGRSPPTIPASVASDGEQDGDAEGDADDRERASGRGARARLRSASPITGRSAARPAPSEPELGEPGDERRRVVVGSRRPSSISSRIRPSPITRTRSA